MWNAYVDGRLSALAEPVRIPRRELDELAGLSERFSRLIEKTIDLVRGDPALLASYGFRPGLRRLLDSEPTRSPDRARPLRRLPHAGRLALLRVQLRRPRRRPRRRGPQPPDRGKPFPLPGRRVARRVALPRHRPPDRRDLLRLGLRGRPRAVPVPSPRMGPGRHPLGPLQSREPRLERPRPPRLRRALDVVYRFFPVEWMTEVGTIDALLSASRSGRLPMINGFSSSSRSRRRPWPSGTSGWTASTRTSAT